MNKKILTFDTYAHALEFTAAKIKAAKANLDEKHILLAPEKDTLKCEQLLMRGGGAMHAEVYSLSRWFHKLGGGEVLSPSGAAMILKEILLALDLKCFLKSKGFNGFCVKLFDTLCELDNAKIDLNSIRATGSLGLKIEDLVRILEEFKKRTQGMYVGRAGKIRLICQKLNEKNFLENACVYAANFGRISASEGELFALIAAKAKGFLVATTKEDYLKADFLPKLDAYFFNKTDGSLIEYNAKSNASNVINNGSNIKSDGLNSTKKEENDEISASLTTYNASSDIACLKAVASRMRALARSGESFDEICLVMPKSLTEQAKRIFNEYDIPFFADKSLPLKSTKLSQYLSLLISLNMPTRKGYITLAKNPYSGISPHQSDVFENYVNAFMIDYLAFSSPFTLMDEDKNPQLEQQRLTIAEGVRKILFGRVNGFWQTLNSLKSEAELPVALKKILDEIEATAVRANDNQTKNTLKNQANQIQKNTKKYVENQGTDTPQKHKIFAVIDSLSRYMCSEKQESITKKRLHFLLETLEEGISAESLSTIPRVQGCVVAGDAGIFKGSRFKHTFIVGFNEGKIPAYDTGSSLISEDECKALNLSGARLPTKTDMNLQKEFELIQILRASQNVFIGYSHTAEARPSPLLYEILQRSKNVTKTGAEEDRLTIEMGNNDELVRLAGGKASALELLILTKNNPSRLTSALNSVFNTSAQKYLEEKPKTPPLSSEFSPFFRGETASATQIERYFSCPYQHFIRHGLMAKERKSGKADVRDIGIAVHTVVEKYARTGFDESKLGMIVSGVLSKGIYRLEANTRLKERLKNEIISTCTRFGNLIKKGKFKLLGAEIRFGKAADFASKAEEEMQGGKTQDGITPENIGLEKVALEGITLEGITLKGGIDYADTHNGYVRIIDYKTGSASLTDKEVYYGKKLQLPLYMLTMRQNGLIPAAMLYFVFKEKWMQDDYVFKGITLSDLDVLCAMDLETIENGLNSLVGARINEGKNGSVISGGGTKSSQDFNLYLNYAELVSGLAIKQIREGNISPSPLKDGQKYSCDYCQFLPACGFCGAPRQAESAQITKNPS